MTVRYANGGTNLADRPMNVLVNGAPAGTIAFASTGSNGWANWTDVTFQLTLQDGANTIRLANQGMTGPNIDRIQVTRPGTVADTTADADGNLALAALDARIDATEITAAPFRVTGLDADIVKVEVSFDGGTTRLLVTPAADGSFALDLTGRPNGTSTATLFATDAEGNVAQATAPVVVDTQVVLPPFSLEIQAETFAKVDTTGLTGTALTQARVPGNTEPNALPPAQDANGDRLWDGFTGGGYLDMGSDIGDAATFTVDAPAAGEYTLTFRYSNGSNVSGANTDRPMTVAVGSGPAVTVPFAGTGLGAWDVWGETSVKVILQAGSNTIKIANTIANGPNIDKVTVTRPGTVVEPDVEPGLRETININFQDGAAPKAAGYLVDNFQGFGARGNGYTYGWVTESSAIDADGTTATPINGASYPAVAINERTGAPFTSYDPRLTGYAHFDLGTTYPSGAGNRVAWEIALEDGWYEVTIAVGDTGGPNDSSNRLFVEGQLATSFTSTDLYKSQLVTTLAKVTDGFLTLSAQGGTITEMQYLQIRELPDLTPADGREAPADYAFFNDARAVAGVGQESVTVDLDLGPGARPEGVDPTSDIFVGVSVVVGRGGALLESLNDGSIKLYETLTASKWRSPPTPRPRATPSRSLLRGT
jgi:hypothetical protein